MKGYNLPQLTTFMSNLQGMRNTRCVAYHDHDDDDDDDDVVQVFHEGPTKSHWTHHVFPEVLFLKLSAKPIID